MLLKRKLNTLAMRCEKPTHWKRPWFGERLKAGGEGATEHRGDGWHHQFNAKEFEQTQGDNEGQGSLVCSSPQSHRELDMTEQLNNRKISTWIIFSSYFIFSTMQTKIFKITYIICIIFLLYDAIWENVGRQANDTARKPLKLASM